MHFAPLPCSEVKAAALARLNARTCHGFSMPREEFSKRIEDAILQSAIKWTSLMASLKVKHDRYIAEPSILNSDGEVRAKREKSHEDNYANLLREVPCWPIKDQTDPLLDLP